MHALVVFESMYGNTEAIARAIADGLSSRMTVEIVEVGAAPSRIPNDLHLLVVGGPTHAHGMSNPGTRRSAGGKAPGGPVSSGIGIHEWLDGLTGGSPGTAAAGTAAAGTAAAGTAAAGTAAGTAAAGTAAAAFDTHIKGPHLVWGGAARPIGERLRRLGCQLVAPPEGFHVEGPLGPVVDVVAEGEIERARRWGAELGAKVGAGDKAVAPQPPEQPA
jgi:hypothetical protein